MTRRCEGDYDDGVCLAPLDRYGNCTRRGGRHDETGEWVPDHVPTALGGES